MATARLTLTTTLPSLVTFHARKPSPYVTTKHTNMLTTRKAMMMRYFNTN